VIVVPAHASIDFFFGAEAAMRSTVTTAGLCLLSLIAACERSPNDPLPDPQFSVSNGVVASATGSAHRIRGDELWVLSFTAVQRADGRVTGQAHIDRKDQDVAWDVDVTCLSVSGNTAWIGGIIQNQRGDVAINGRISYFYVIDNGEGDNASADVASAIRVNDVAGEDLAFCSDQPLLLPASPVEHGNVQVRS
jgi:hypothetical protein